MTSDPSSLHKAHAAPSLWERKRLAVEARKLHEDRVGAYRASLGAADRALLDLLLYVPRCRVCDLMPGVGVQAGHEDARPVCDACRVKRRSLQWSFPHAHSVRFAIRKLGEANVRDAARLIQEMRLRK